MVELIVRKIELYDLPLIEEIAKPIYFPELWESSECFAQKLKMFPNGCLLAHKGSEVIGYCFSHPWLKDDIVPLDSIVEIPKATDCYYIHDLAVDVKHQGSGIGRLLFTKILESSKEYNLIRLVSVLDSHVFWMKLGFKIVETIQYTPEVYGFIMEMET